MNTILCSFKALPKLVHILLFLFCVSGISYEEDGADNIEIFNVYTRKCLSFAQNDHLELVPCSDKRDKLFKWTADGKVKKANSGNQSRCIQVNNKSVTTGDCNSKYSVTWTCKDRTLLTKTKNWYLTWNNESNIVEVTKIQGDRKALWILHDTDNKLCDWPNRPALNSTPFIQPVKKEHTEKIPGQPWPQGFYTLPKAASGCPCSTNFTWQEGWIFQDLDDMNDIKTKSSRSFNMAAIIDEWGNIKRWFCTKNNHTINEFQIRPLWPEGTYCIYSAAISPKDEKCPKTEGSFPFNFGYGFWDNQYLLNDSEMKGTLPRGDSVTQGRTNIYFCCQENQHPNNPISLPIETPFYLLAFKSNICQKVKWATVTPEFIVYDTSDYNNKDAFILFTPFNATRNDPKIYYCYYEGCNHTLSYNNETEGEIVFPNSQFLDIASQSCSWRITFPPDHIISLNILSLNIPTFHSQRCIIQFLEIFHIEGRVSTLKLCGNHHQYKLHSQTNSVLIVVKLSKNVTNTTGFRLNFKGILNTGRSTFMAKTIPANKTEKPFTTEPYRKIETEPTATYSKEKKSKVATIAAIVVPIAIIIVLIGAGLATARIIVMRKRILKEASTSVTFQNEHERENPIYENVVGNEVTGGNRILRIKINAQQIVFKRESSDVFKFIENDNDLVSAAQAKQNNREKPILHRENEHINSNPLYEKADQSDYLSTANSLYISSEEVE